jgi:outer membrane assembly lipoprotein YfiO
MRTSLATLLPLTGCLLLTVGCGLFQKESPLLAGPTGEVVEKGEALYLQAKQADDAGKTSRAIKLYRQTATRYSFAPSAPQARFRQAELLEQRGEIVKAFEAYQEFIIRFQASSLYSSALSRQAAMAQSAAEGDVKSNFLGLKSRLSLDKTVEMLGMVRDNAPKTATAAKAQFTIGELYHSKKKSQEAIEAFRTLVREQPESPLAAEALFQVGVIFTAEADRGNRNQATLDLAAEAFQDYLIQYPNHRRAGEARANLASIRERELKRALETAAFYEKTGQYEAAKVYYRDIVRRAKSGPTHDSARERLRQLGE